MPTRPRDAAHHLRHLPPGGVALLTPAQARIAAIAAEGMDASGIAERLGISLNAVRVGICAAVKRLPPPGSPLPEPLDAADRPVLLRRLRATLEHLPADADAVLSRQEAEIAVLVRRGASVAEVARGLRQPTNTVRYAMRAMLAALCAAVPDVARHALVTRAPPPATPAGYGVAGDAKGATLLRRLSLGDTLARAAHAAGMSYGSAGARLRAMRAACEADSIELVIRQAIDTRAIAAPPLIEIPAGRLAPSLAGVLQMLSDAASNEDIGHALGVSSAAASRRIGALHAAVRRLADLPVAMSALEFRRRMVCGARIAQRPQSDSLPSVFASSDGVAWRRAS